MRCKLVELGGHARQVGAVLGHQRRCVKAWPCRSDGPRMLRRCPVGGAPAAAPSPLRRSTAAPSAWRRPPGPAASACCARARCSTAAAAARPLWHPRAPPNRGLPHDDPGLPQLIPASGARRRVGTLPLFKRLMRAMRSACRRHSGQRAAALLSRRSRCGRCLKQRVAGHGGRLPVAAASGGAHGCADASRPAQRGAKRAPACGGQARLARAPCRSRCQWQARCSGGAERCSRRLRSSPARARACGQGLSQGAAGWRAVCPPRRRGFHRRSCMLYGGGATHTPQQHMLGAACSGKCRILVICSAWGRAAAGSRTAQQRRRCGAQGRRPRPCTAW